MTRNLLKLLLIIPLTLFLYSCGDEHMSRHSDQDGSDTYAGDMIDASSFDPHADIVIAHPRHGNIRYSLDTDRSKLFDMIGGNGADLFTYNGDDFSGETSSGAGYTDTNSGSSGGQGDISSDDNQDDTSLGGDDTYTSSDASDNVCEIERTFPIIAGQSINIGNYTYKIEGTNLTVTIDTTNNWNVGDIHLYVSGLEPAPTPPRPGHFQIKKNPNGQDPYLFTIDLAEFSVTNIVYLALHMEASRIVDGEVVQAETAWGFGNIDSFNHWGWQLSLPLCE